MSIDGYEPVTRPEGITTGRGSPLERRRYQKPELYELRLVPRNLLPAHKEFLAHQVKLALLRQLPWWRRFWSARNGDINDVAWMLVSEMHEHMLTMNYRKIEEDWRDVHEFCEMVESDTDAE
jgi:hypothetical protein